MFALRILPDFLFFLIHTLVVSALLIVKTSCWQPLRVFPSVQALTAGARKGSTHT